jgi:prephenate dehydrogenase
MVVALLGFGRFGRALGSLLSEARVAYRALDPAVTVPEAVRAPALPELIDGASLVVLAVPVPRTREALESVRPHLGRDHVVLDVGSVKVHPYGDLEAVLGAEIPWVATHPLFGPVSLALAERPLRVVVCPSPRHPGAAARASELYRRIGCEVIQQTPESHDRVMAHTHALTFFVAKGMLDAGAGREVPFAPPSFQAVSRTIETVRSDAGHLFAAIQRENPFAAEARHQLLEALVEIDRALEAGPIAGAPEASRFHIPDLGARSPELRRPGS